MELNRKPCIPLPVGDVIEYALDFNQAHYLIQDLMYAAQTLELVIDEYYSFSGSSYIILRSVTFPEKVQSNIDTTLVIPACSISLAGYKWYNL